MSRENVELVYRAVDAFNRRDLNAFLALVDPDVEFTTRFVERGGSYHGHDGVRMWWEDLLSVFSDFRVEADEVRNLGDMTVTRLRLRGQGIESEARMEQTDWQATKWRHKKAIWWRTFRSEAEALEAAGLSE
jgi:ketosteroid isomerase-like protein